MPCISPLTSYKSGTKVTYPCGKCEHCRGVRALDWQSRLQAHFREHPVAQFVTLTYSDDNCPELGVIKRHIQLFFKRLRRRMNFHDNQKISYYVTAEYGERTYRPHYHCIIFGDISSDVIVSCWPYGHIHCGTVTYASIRYTLKYITDAVSAPNGMNPPFRLISNGMGISYAHKMSDYHKDNLVDRRYLITHDGHKLHMPRYLRDKIYSDEDKLHLSQYDESITTCKSLTSEDYQLMQRDNDLRRNYEAVRRMNRQSKKSTQF